MTRAARSALTVDVMVGSELWKDAGKPEAAVRRAVTRAAAMLSTGAAELAIVLTDDLTIRALNRVWRGVDKPTNVLAFPTKHAAAGHLGDIVLAFETISREARCERKLLAHHLAHLAVTVSCIWSASITNGPRMRLKMERTERKILRQLAPAGLGLRPDPGSRLLAGGTVLVGGSPVRVLRLTPSGARHVAGWWSGTPVPDHARARALARRLLDTGIAHPALSPAAMARAWGPGDVTVVIPVRDRQAELARCLAGLAQMPRVIVVDDGSGDPAAVARVASGAGAGVLRRAVNGGPAAARNTGLAAADTPLVAFLDSDCVPGPGWLDALLPHFADPAVGAVAPRIVPDEPGRTWLARYEGASSTLDMGARASIVRPGSRVPYVPGAALVVRRAAAGTGFTETMRIGEDVDFVLAAGRVRLAGAL